MISFNWVIARGIMIIIFIPISLAWSDFFRDYISPITELCPKVKCQKIPTPDRILILIILTILGFLVMWLIYRFTPIFDFHES